MVGNTVHLECIASIACVVTSLFSSRHVLTVLYAGGQGDMLGGVGEETVVFRAFATLLPHPAATLLI